MRRAARSRQDELNKAAGAALRKLREIQGLSQERVAIDADVDQSRLSKVEHLGPTGISWQTFCRIAAVLGHEVEIRFRPVASEE
jgi:transcriptional regulator with XRE-family HTH domain